MDRNATAPISTAAKPRYLELVEAFPLRPIRDDRALAGAIAAMRPLLGIDRSDDEEDYLEVLGGIIKAYEDEHHPMPSSPVDSHHAEPGP